MVTRGKPRALAGRTIMGATVVGADGEELGRLEDVVIDFASGQVRYAVLSFGGFLGIADKFFAVPWDALAVDPGHEQFVLNIHRELLEGAPGFDKDHWPDMADERFTHAMRAHYGPRLAATA